MLCKEKIATLEIAALQLVLKFLTGYDLTPDNGKVKHLIFLRGGNSSLKEIKLIQINYTDCVINIRTSSRTIIANNFLSSCVIEGDFGEVGHSILLFANKIDCKLPQKVKNLGLFLKSLIK